MGLISPLLAQVEELYAQGYSAYWLPPIVGHRGGKPIGRIRAGDSVIFCCRRGEREIQLTDAFTDPSFSAFSRELLSPLTFVPLVLYHPKFEHLPVAFPTSPVRETLGEVVSQAGLRQLRLAEEEKLAHVTYFLNGKRHEPFAREQVCSVRSFLDDPLRALPSLGALLRAEAGKKLHELIAVNIASGDLMGHSDELHLKEQCAEAVDRILGEMLATAAEHDFVSVVTADHGLLEEHGMLGEAPNTSHTTHPVPFICIPPDRKPCLLVHTGTLADVAPTVLSILGLQIPESMSGRSLVKDNSLRAERVLLAILDGWGLPEPGHINPIETASTPTWDRISKLPVASLSASGRAVGLLAGRKGNSESGHMTIGAGRAVQQDDVIIDEAIRNGTFAEAEAFETAFSDAAQRGGAVHLLALLSQTSSHGSIDYAMELARFARKANFGPVYVHIITDGRSTKSERLPVELPEVSQELDDIGTGEIVTLVGRGLALDRGRNYQEKTRPTYEALVGGRGVAANLDD